MSAHEGSAQQARDEDYRASVPVGRRRRSGEAPGDPDFYEAEITALRADNERLTGWLVSILRSARRRERAWPFRDAPGSSEWFDEREAVEAERTARLAQEARALLTDEQYEALMQSPQTKAVRAEDDR